jgi:hypothetical protein
MTASDVLYEVRADNGLGGFVLGREAADELLTELGMRPDVLSVVATPLKPCHVCGTYHNACPELWGGDPETPDGMPCYARQRAFAEAEDRTLAETLAYLGHGEQL